MGYPKGFNLRCLDSWTLGVDPSLKPPDFKSPLQGGQLGVWRFETRSTLHKKVGKIQNALSKIS